MGRWDMNWWLILCIRGAEAAYDPMVLAWKRPRLGGEHDDALQLRVQMRATPVF